MAGSLERTVEPAIRLKAGKVHHSIIPEHHSSLQVHMLKQHVRNVTAGDNSKAHQVPV